LCTTILFIIRWNDGNNNFIYQQACEWRRSAAATVEQRRHVDAPCQGMDALNNTVRNRRRRPSTPSRRRRCTATTRTTAARITITNNSSSNSRNSNTSNCCCNSNFTARSNSSSRTLWSDLGPRLAVITTTRCPGKIIVLQVSLSEAVRQGFCRFWIHFCWFFFYRLSL